ncbi:MAG TPA: NUDIX domain-containing protein [Candidatus Saccharimonadales bacterium]|nr:NUDIX domain-containing protein [Candidatus Saccharimonadales bacterium]
MKAGIDYIGVSVGAFIINDEGDVLLVKRSQNAKNEKGKWEAPGGAVEFGEKLEDAIRREMKEELGIEIEILTQWVAKDHLLADENQHWVPTTFLVKIKGEQKPQIMEPHKHDAMGWFALNNFPSPLSVITQIDKKGYEEYLSLLRTTT